MFLQSLAALAFLERNAKNLFLGLHLCVACAADSIATIHEAQRKEERRIFAFLEGNGAAQRWSCTEHEFENLGSAISALIFCLQGQIYLIRSIDRFCNDVRHESNARTRVRTDFNVILQCKLGRMFDDCADVVKRSFVGVNGDLPYQAHVYSKYLVGKTAEGGSSRSGSGGTSGRRSLNMLVLRWTPYLQNVCCIGCAALTMASSRGGDLLPHVHLSSECSSSRSAHPSASLHKVVFASQLWIASIPIYALSDYHHSDSNEPATNHTLTSPLVSGIVCCCLDWLLKLILAHCYSQAGDSALHLPASEQIRLPTVDTTLVEKVQHCWQHDKKLRYVVKQLYLAVANIFRIFDADFRAGLHHNHAEQAKTSHQHHHGTEHGLRSVLQHVETNKQIMRTAAVLLPLLHVSLKRPVKESLELMQLVDKTLVQQKLQLEVGAVSACTVQSSGTTRHLEVRSADIRLKNSVYLSLLSCSQLDPERCSRRLDGSNGDDINGEEAAAAGFDVLYDDGVEEMAIPLSRIRRRGEEEQNNSENSNGRDDEALVVGSKVFFCFLLVSLTHHSEVMMCMQIGRVLIWFVLLSCLACSVLKRSQG